jgi:hypothetical protein
MSEALATQPVSPLDPAIIERVLLHGDLRQLTPAQKVSYYDRVCASLGLNPLTQPFAYLVLNGKEILYAKREATEQLRFNHAISIEIKAREIIEGCYVVTAAATMPSGRKDESTGVVSIEGSKGEDRANRMMKGETKAKRRVTLSICGLGMLDETEAETIPGAQVMDISSFTPEEAEPAVPAQQAPVITEAQAKRFHVIAREAGWKPDDLKRWLMAAHSLSSSRAIPRDRYDAIIGEVQRGAVAAVRDDNSPADPMLKAEDVF